MARVHSIGKITSLDLRLTPAKGSNTHLDLMAREDIEKKILGEFFKQRRINVELSQGDVAKHFGWTSAQFISNWERGRSLPSKSILLDLMKLYRISKKDIVNIHTYATKMSLQNRLNKPDVKLKRTC